MIKNKIKVVVKNMPQAYQPLEITGNELGGNPISVSCASFVRDGNMMIAITAVLE